MADEEEKVETKEQEKKLEDDVVMINQGKKESQDGFKVIKCNPQPLIVCQHKGSNVIKELVSDLGPKLTISALQCQYLTSRPTGQTNIAISEEYLNKYTTRRKIDKPIVPQTGTGVGTSANGISVNVSNVLA